MCVITDKAAIAERDVTNIMMVAQVGRLELPPELLQSGPVVSPYLSTWSIGTAGTGAGAIKSRNNLARAAQLIA